MYCTSQKWEIARFLTNINKRNLVSTMKFSNLLIYIQNVKLRFSVDRSYQQTQSLRSQKHNLLEMMHLIYNIEMFTIYSSQRSNIIAVICDKKTTVSTTTSVPCPKWFSSTLHLSQLPLPFHHPSFALWHQQLYQHCPCCHHASSWDAPGLALVVMASAVLCQVRCAAAEKRAASVHATKTKDKMSVKYKYGNK